MKDIIQDRLNRISDLSERRLLKNIMYDVFENVADYNMDMYAKLEQRIYDELEDPLEKFYIYTGLDSAANIDPISDFLHPMLPSDLEDRKFDMEEIHERLTAGRELVLTSVFLKCGSPVIKEMFSRKKAYKGYVKTDRDIYEIQVALRPCRKYINEIDRLYRSFQKNGIAWNTVNCPYAYKFADVVLSSSLALKPGEKITEITVDLAEYEKYKVIDAVPLWNVKHIAVQDKSFPMPAVDRINYDHVIALGDLGIQNGYIAGSDNMDFIYFKRSEQALTIISPVNEQSYWELIQIENPENDRRKNYTYEVMNNRRKLGFIGRYANQKSIVLRTRGEVVRQLQTYDLSRELHFRDMEIIERYTREEETTDFNSFIDDNLRVDSYKKILVLKFRPEDRENFLIYDKLSFLVSEIQIMFPEYKCIGELV